MTPAIRSFVFFNMSYFSFNKFYTLIYYKSYDDTKNMYLYTIIFKFMWSLNIFGDFNFMSIYIPSFEFSNIKLVNFIIFWDYILDNAIMNMSFYDMDIKPLFSHKKGEALGYHLEMLTRKLSLHSSNPLFLLVLLKVMVSYQILKYIK